jgi:hypothetical protein
MVWMAKYHRILLERVLFIATGESAVMLEFSMRYLCGFDEVVFNQVAASMSVLPRSGL